MSALRHLKGVLRLATFLRREQLALLGARAISTTNVRMEKIKGNPYYAKYAEKLKKMQEDNPEEFESKVNTVAEKHKQELDDKKKVIEEMEAKRKEEASQIKPGTLGSVMNVDLIKDKTPEEIEQIWKVYHKDKDFIFAVIQKDEYEVMSRKLQEFGTFLYPLPRGEGYEFFLQQTSANTLNFTPLIQYQAHQENAPIALTITHYEELLEDKGVVLMRGEPDTKILSLHESQLLALQVKMYYGLQSGLKFNYVRIMNTAPDSFRHLDLIKQFGNFKKDALLSQEDRLSKEVD